MKDNMYDLFSGYDGELPEITEEPCNADRITQLAMQKIGNQPVRKHGRRRIVLLTLAAALIAVSGVTAAAASGKLELFRSILSRTALHEGGSSLPLMEEETTPEELAEMEPLVMENAVHFTGDDILRISTVCLYHDTNTLMMTLAVEVQYGVTLPKDAQFIPYFTIDTEDGEELLHQSGMGATESLVPGEREGLYYLTYYLVRPELAGKTIHARLENAYSPEQIQTVFEGIQSAQIQWMEDYGADSMTTDEWKALWKAEDLDGRTLALTQSLLDESDKALEGTWTADIPLTDTEEPLLSIDKSGYQIAADSLSVEINYEEQYGKQPVFLFTMRDGTVLTTSTGNGIAGWLTEHNALPENYQRFAHVRGTDTGQVYSYGSLCRSDRIQKIEVYLFEYNLEDYSADKQFKSVTSEVLYEKEGRG